MTPEEVAEKAQQAKREDRKRTRRENREIDRELAAESRGPVPTLIAYRADELPHVKFAPRTPLLYHRDQVFLYSGQIAEVFARRGDGKTWFLLTLALLMAYGKTTMGFEARTRHRVLYVDGEMQRQDIVERVMLLAERMGISLTLADLISPSSYLTIVAADWQTEPMPRLDTPEGQLALQPYVDEADVVMFDNRSCLFDPEGEKDPTAWQPAGDYLLLLRRVGKAVMLAHHANRQGGARGIGKPEDPMDMVIQLARPEGEPDEGATFRLSVQPEDGGKARGLWGPAAIPFTVKLTPSGWIVVEDKKPGAHEAIEARIIAYFEHLMSLDDDEQLPKTMTAAISQVTGDKGDKIAVFTRLVAKKRIVKINDHYQLIGEADVEPPDEADVESRVERPAVVVTAASRFL